MSNAATELESLLAGFAERGAYEVVGGVMALDEGALEGLATQVEVALEKLPAPIGSGVEADFVHRRRYLRLVRGAIEARRGNASRLLSVAREIWLRGGSHADYLRIVLHHGNRRRAISMAMTLLEHQGEEDRAGLEEMLAEGARVPDGWADAVAELAREPTEARWRELQRFTPPEYYEERVRWTVRLLARLGVDPDALFALSTMDGPNADAIHLAERGEVHPKVIEERAARAPKKTRPLWYGLAARSACMRGDRLGAVRLLREAYKGATAGASPDRDLAFVRAHADAELNELLDRAGLPDLDARPSDR